jgi:BirA family biotin operon repressor/biotin-[acetyl-CoA-carboxylase] ligase
VNKQGDSLLPEVIRQGLPRSLFTRVVHCFHVIESTNSYAKELGTQGEPEGALVIAETQIGGKGRLGRRWHSPPGVNLLFSTLFRPPFSIDRVFSLTMVTAVSLVEAINEVTGLRSLIKWPNDIYCNGKKMAGVLTEFSADRTSVDYVVVGTGLNVNWDMRSRPELEHVATSLMNEVGHAIPRVALLLRILEQLESNYTLLLRGEGPLIRDRWNRHSMVIGKEVVIGPEGQEKRARVTGIDRNGALLIEEENGTASSIVCGDVRVLFPSLPGNPP